MTDFSEEQLAEIERVIRKLGFNADSDDVKVFIDELTRKPVEFGEGEVYARPAVDAATYHRNGKSHWPDGDARKLSTTESGAGELVIALRAIATVMNADATYCSKTAIEALDKWLSARGEA